MTVVGGTDTGMNLSRSKPPRQRSAEAAVAFQEPLPAHGFAAGGVAFGIEQHPGSSTRGARAEAGIVHLKTRLNVHGPADIGALIRAASAAEDVGKGVRGHVFMDRRRLAGMLRRQRSILEAAEVYELGFEILVQAFHAAFAAEAGLLPAAKWDDFV